jgi:hypothetical protein
MGINFLTQNWLPNQKMALTLRAGGGISFQVGDLNSGENLYLMDRLVPLLNLEPSFLWRVLEHLYVETGLSFTFFLNRNNSSACLRPWLGVGWSF